MHCRCIFNEFSFIQIYTVEFYYYAEVLDKKNSIYLLEIGSRCDTPHSIELQAKESRVNERCTWRLCAFVWESIKVCCLKYVTHLLNSMEFMNWLLSSWSIKQPFNSFVLAPFVYAFNWSFVCRERVCVPTTQLSISIVIKTIFQHQFSFYRMKSAAAFIYCQQQNFLTSIYSRYPTISDGRSYV